MTKAETDDDSRGLRRGRTAARLLLAVAYGAAGVLHMTRPEPFLAITPDWVPYAPQVIFATGVCEVVGAGALLSPRLRKAAGAALALYAVCVYPANIKHAFEAVPAGGVHLTWWYHAPRLLMQPVLVWWALFAGGLVTWPFGSRPPSRRSGSASDLSPRARP